MKSKNIPQPIILYLCTGFRQNFYLCAPVTLDHEWISAQRTERWRGKYCVQAGEHGKGDNPYPELGVIST